MIDSDLYREHQQLCHKLQMFINQARINEQKMQRFQNLELRLIGSRRFSELCNEILTNYKNEFALDTVTLTLLDDNYELRRIVAEGKPLSKLEGAELDNLIFYNREEQLTSLFPRPFGPQLGEFDIDKHALLIAPLSPPLQSIASLPLVRFDRLIGCINLGSSSKERFSNEFGTEFLQRLATIVAICLENTINHERLKQVGLTDALTGVNNRRFFDQRVNEEVARSLRSREPLGCLFIDIDHFKRINDELGHPVGDTVLREVASIIREQLRNSDVLGRYGGEEFSALLTNTRASTAKDIAERIRATVENHRFDLRAHHKVSKPLNVTISIGIAVMSEANPITEMGSLCASLIKQADQSLYQAKNQGRNQVVYNPSTTDTPNHEARVFDTAPSNC